MTRNTAERELVFDDVAGIPLELAVSPRRSPGFVTGAVGRTAPEVVECPYCGTPGWADHHSATCARCGAPVRATPPPPPPAPRLPSAPPPPAPLLAASRGEAIADAVATVPFGIWKRLPFYAFLAMVLGNGCLCGGLSGRVNVVLALLIVVGLAGVVLSLQRRP